MGLRKVKRSAAITGRISPGSLPSYDVSSRLAPALPSGKSAARRVIALLAALVTACAMAVFIAAPAQAAPLDEGRYVDNQGIVYGYQGDKAVVNKSPVASGNIVIPATIRVNNRLIRVISIVEEAFAGTRLNHVIIGSNVQSIGEDAFRGTNLKYLRLGDSVSVIRAGAFAGNSALRYVVFDGNAPSEKNFASAGTSGSFGTASGVRVTYRPSAKDFTSRNWNGYSSSPLTKSSEICEVALFFDVSGGEFCAMITWLVARNIADGYSDGTFRPGDEISRQAMAAYLYRLANNGRAAPKCTTSPYKDVSTSNPFCGEIKWMKDKRYTGGYDDGTFRPGDDISRQAMAAQLYRYKNSDRAAPNCTTRPLPDVDTRNPFCGEIKWMKDKGITSGSTFNPENAVSRQAMAAFLYRL